jgi:hypothetical protein
MDDFKYHTHLMENSLVLIGSYSQTLKRTELKYYYNFCCQHYII